MDITEIAVVLIFSVASGIAEAILDVITNPAIHGVVKKKGYLKSPFWNPAYSWKYKYNVLGDYQIKSWRKFDTHWYYFGLHKPRFPEAFPFSSTLFVGFTDGFHRMKSIMSFSWLTVALFATVATHPVYLVLGFHFLSMYIFHITFHYLKK